ncbi:DUF3300 domain-containing protein [Lysobacter niabensis]|uniref:DUF3300 domain-containing protein n=1 Tax=Agrilutibacter niabensis TaxID=380628 RepID=UPI0036096EF9
MAIFGRSLCIGLLLATAGVSLAAPQQAATSAQAAASSGAAATFSNAELDQMTAPIALYPDTLLAQVLMATTYPGDVADAAKWSKQNKNAKGEDAVKQVENQPWDPSVQSLVAFPQVLDTLSQDPAWVQKLGDAFLAQPDAVMASVQRLRNKAQEAGNLKSNEQQVVKTEPATGVMVEESIPQTIIIESSNPEVVYVPSYSSSVYGPWAYPAYPPYYYGYYPGAALFSFGVGVAIGGALWGDCNWGGGDIDIDVNNNFNRNTNRERTTNRGDRGQGGKWQHNSANRDGVPYRDQRSRDQFGKGREGAAQRDSYRGRDPSRDASRDRARQSMSSRGFDTPATSNREARDRAGQASRQMDRGQVSNRGSASNNMQSRSNARQQYSGSRDQARNSNAFAGSRGSASQTRQSSSRGHSSYSSSRSSAGRSSAGRQMSRPARGGGGGGRRR